MSKKQVVGVFCTEKDLQDPFIIKVALGLNIITKDEIKSDNTVEYTDEQLKKILWGLFGFNNGHYEKQVFEKQRTFFGNKLVENCIRYTGVERQDKDWVESSMCSQQTREIVKFGTVL